jgi:hypothetical protein
MKSKILIPIIAMGLLVLSCEDFLDVNTDPNNPETVSPDLVLPVGLNYTSGYIGGDRQLNHLGSMMMYSYGEAEGFDWYASEFNYLLTGGFYAQMFQDPYTRSLKQYNVLTQQPERFGYYNAIGNIMQAYHFQIMVDLYGSIPYSEALQRGGNATPTYNDPQAVYDSLIVQLTDAVNTIDQTNSMAGAAQVGSDDGVFGGDMNKWGAFANSIKIRILTRESDVKDASYINSELANIQNNGYGYITDNVGINPGYIASEDGKQNPYWTDFGIGFDGSSDNTYLATPATQFVINFFQGLNDPRLDLIFETPSSGTHKGINQGSKELIANTDDLGPDGVSNFNMPSSFDDANGPSNATLGDDEGVLRGPEMATIIMTQAELEFNFAELALEGFNVSGTARSHYEAGITASFQYLGLTASDATAYYSQSMQNVNWNASSSNQLNAIMTQKWLGLFGLNMGQVWFDYNRTGYPNAEPIGVSSSPIATAPSGFPISLETNESDRPVRLLYPNSEASRNSENVPENSGINPFVDKIFWAQ